MKDGLQMTDSQSSASEGEGGYSPGQIIDIGLGVGAQADWVTPGYRWLRGLMEGPCHDYDIVDSGGMTGRDIDLLLNKYGVRHFGMWGVGITQDEYMICVKVPIPHCQRAEQVFRSHHITIGTPVDPKRLAEHRLKKMQRRNKKKPRKAPRLTSGQIARRQQLHQHQIIQRQRRAGRTWRDYIDK